MWHYCIEFEKHTLPCNQMISYLYLEQITLENIVYSINQWQPSWDSNLPPEPLSLFYGQTNDLTNSGLHLWHQAHFTGRQPFSRAYTYVWMVEITLQWRLSTSTVKLIVIYCGAINFLPKSLQQTMVHIIFQLLVTDANLSFKYIYWVIYSCEIWLQNTHFCCLHINHEEIDINNRLTKCLFYYLNQCYFITNWHYAINFGEREKKTAFQKMHLSIMWGHILLQC